MMNVVRLCREIVKLRGEKGVAVCLESMLTKFSDVPTVCYILHIIETGVYRESEVW